MYIRHITNVTVEKGTVHLSSASLSKESLNSAVLNILNTFRQYRKGHKLDILIVCRFEYSLEASQKISGLLASFRSIAKRHHFHMRTTRTEDSKTYISKSGETWVYKVELEFTKEFWKANKQQELPL